MDQINDQNMDQLLKCGSMWINCSNVDQNVDQKVDQLLKYGSNIYLRPYESRRLFGKYVIFYLFQEYVLLYVPDDARICLDRPNDAPSFFKVFRGISSFFSSASNSQRITSVILSDSTNLANPRRLRTNIRITNEQTDVHQTDAISELRQAATSSN